MKKTMISTMIMISLVWLTSLAFASPEEYQPEYYDNAKVLRVKYTQGESFITRSYDEGREEAAINLPIFEKDSAGTTDGRMEIYLGRLNYLRMDQDSEVVFDKVPELRKTGLTLRILKGGIYLEVENIDFERDIEIQTPDCGVFLLDKGSYRLNVTESGRTELFVLDGIAEVAGENYTHNVRENQKIVMYNGQVKERPFYFYASDKDDFDQWNRERNGSEGYAKYSSTRYLEDGYEDYEYEMSRNGNWRYDNSYNSYVWSPYSISDDWRPYSNGRWVWTPHYGYVWTSYDSCGYFTHHYGRWSWDPVSRWCWIPGYHWSPAWVSWFWDNDYYGWCPMSYWNRPIVVLNGRWWRNYDYSRGIPWHARSTTIIRKGQLSASNIGHAALKGSDVSGISKKSIIFRGKAPAGRPSMAHVNVINAKGKTVVYNKNSFVSKAKYKQIDRNNSGLAKTGIEKDTLFKYSGSKTPKEKLSKYSQPDENRSNSIKSNAFKYKSNITSKTPDYPGSKGSSSGMATPYRNKPYKSNPESYSGNNSGDSSSGSRVKKNTPKSYGDKSSIKSSGGNSGSKSSSSSSSKPIKKKKEGSSPSYSSYGRDADTGSSSDSSYSSDSTSKSSYSSRSYKSYTPTRSTSSSSSSSSRPSYKSSSSYKAPIRSNSSSSSPSSYSSHSSYKSSSPSSYSGHSSSSSISRSSSSSSSSRSSGSSKSSMKSSSSGSSSSSSRPAKKKN